MTASFSITRLVNSQALVTGEDKNGKQGETVVSTWQWDHLNRRTAEQKAIDAHAETVTEFFKPLTEAAEKLEAARLGADEDPITYLVQRTATEGVPGQQEERVRLDDSSIILRLIETGQHDRLVWVNDHLAVTEKAPAVDDVLDEPAVLDA